MILLAAFIFGGASPFFINNKEQKSFYSASIPANTTMQASLIGLSVKDTLSNWSVFNASYILGGRHEKVCKYIGITNFESLEYKAYLELKKVASNNDLLKLLESKKPVIKAYAIQALLERDLPGMINVFENHITDKDVFIDLCGCIGMPVPVNVYFLKCLSPKITKAQYERYKKMILAMNPGEINPFKII